MASPEAQNLKDAFTSMRRNLASGEPRSLDDRRKAAAILGLLASQPSGITYTDVDAGGVPAIWAAPANGSSEHVLQYLHGGGYVLGDADAYRRFTGHLANLTGCRVLNVDYRLAPEHPHPAPVSDSVAAYRWLLAQGFSPNNIALAGDSAGGGLTVATLVALRDAGDPQPSCAAPISPWIDLEGTGESMTSNAATDVLIDAAGIRQSAELFLAGGDPHDPLAAPLFADLSNLPPLYVQVGEDETLRDDSVRLVDAAIKAGVDATLEVFPEMQHVFQLSVGQMPEATLATEKICSYLQTKMGL